MRKLDRVDYFLLAVIVIILGFALYSSTNNQMVYSAFNPTSQLKLLENSTDEYANKVLDRNIRHYENKYNIKMPPIEIYLIDNLSEIPHIPVTMDTAGFYISGYKLYNGSYEPAQIGIIDQEYQYEHTVKHELCHHYLQSVCKFSKYYGTLDNTNKPKLNSKFEEPFCEGYAQLDFSPKIPLVNQTYSRFFTMPEEFFECGFKTCNPLECYKQQTGKEWKLNT